MVETLTELTEVQQKILDNPDIVLTAEQMKSIAQTRTISREAAAWRRKTREAEAEVERLKRQTDQYAATLQTLSAMLSTWQRVAQDWEKRS